VTVLTLVGGTNVIKRRRRGLHQAGAAVARHTLPWRPLEDTLNVAALAIRVSMRTFEWPAGREVIEIGTEGRLSVRRRGEGETSQAGGEKQREQRSAAGTHG
jgi:hypothetical protein